MSLSRLLGRWRSLVRQNSAPAWTLGSQLVTSAGNFLTTVIIIRQAGLAEFGRFSVAFIILMITRNYLNALVLVPMSTIGPKLLASSASAYRGFLLANAAVFCCGTSALLYGLASTLGFLIGSPWLSELALALALANAAANLADFMRRFLLVTGQASRSFTLDLIRYLALLPLLFWAEDLFGALNSEVALAVLAFGSVLAAGYGAVFFGSLRWRPVFVRRVWPRHWNFIKWMAPGAALESIQGQAPLFIGAAILGEAALGGVRAIQQLANILSLPNNALQQVAPTMVAHSRSNAGDGAAIRLLIRLVIGGLLILSVASAVVLLGWGKICSFLLNSQNPDLLLIFVMYSIVNMISLATQMTFIFFHSVGRPRVFYEAGVITSVVTIAVASCLIPLIGAIGIPATSLLANLGAVGLLAFRLKQRIDGNGPGAGDRKERAR